MTIRSPVIDLNADLGESFGAWRLGDDEALLSLVTSANIACGFHAGDPLTIRRACAGAIARGVTIGAQVSYRDLAGFGRREMTVPADELTDPGIVAARTVAMATRQEAEPADGVEIAVRPRSVCLHGDTPTGRHPGSRAPSGAAGRQRAGGVVRVLRTRAVGDTALLAETERPPAGRTRPGNPLPAEQSELNIVGARPFFASPYSAGDPYPPPPGVSITNTSPAATATVSHPRIGVTEPSACSTQCRPSAPGFPPAIP